MTERKPTRTKMLSPTQVDILKYLARGDSYPAIARRLGMTPHGIQYHLTSMRHIFQTKSIPAILAMAIVAGVLTSNQWPIEATGDLFIDL
jgi:DNA-binding CsgD family transcriptional regulator